MSKMGIVWHVGVALLLLCTLKASTFADKTTLAPPTIAPPTMTRPTIAPHEYLACRIECRAAHSKCLQENMNLVNHFAPPQFCHDDTIKCLRSCRRHLDLRQTKS